MKFSFLVAALLVPFATLQAYADDSIPQSRQLHDLVVKGQRTYTRYPHTHEASSGRVERYVLCQYQIVGEDIWQGFR